MRSSEEYVVVHDKDDGERVLRVTKATRAQLTEVVVFFGTLKECRIFASRGIGSKKKRGGKDADRTSES